MNYLIIKPYISVIDNTDINKIENLINKKKNNNNNNNDDILFEIIAYCFKNFQNLQLMQIIKI